MLNQLLKNQTHLFLNLYIKLNKMNLLKKEVLNRKLNLHNKHLQNTRLESFQIIKAYLSSLHRKLDNSLIEVKKRSNQRKSFTAILQNNRIRRLHLVIDNLHQIQRTNLKFNNRIIINFLHNQVEPLFSKDKIKTRMTATVL